MSNSTNKQRIENVTTRLVTATTNVQSLPDTYDADATSSDIALNKTAYVNGTKITGSATILNGETVTINPSTSQKIVTPTAPRNGITQVTVSAVTSNIDNNIVAGNIKSGVTILGVQGSLEELIGETVTLKSTKVQQIVPPNPGKTGITQITVEPWLVQNKTVTPTTSQQEIFADNGYDALEIVTIKAVTSSIDNNIVPTNIKKNTSILGVTGILESQKDWSAIGYSYSEPQTYIDDGYDYALQIISSWNNVSDLTRKFLSDGRLKYFPLVDTSNATQMQYTFSDCGGLETVADINTSNVKNMSYMFAYSSGLRYVPDFNMGKVTNVTQMFRECKSLKTLPTTINLSKCSSIQYFCANCPSLTTVPTLDLTACTDASYAFQKCFRLKTLTLTNTSALTNLSYFLDMSNNSGNTSDFTTLTIPDTSKVANFSYTFRNCISLVTAPSMNLSKATTVTSMFSGCTSLTTVPLYNLASVNNGSAYINYMFDNCTNLTDTSLDNILQMCISAVKITASNYKKLSILGFKSTYYPAARIQGLPHYSDFTTAGWVIGY